MMVDRHRAFASQHMRSVYLLRTPDVHNAGVKLHAGAAQRFVNQDKEQLCMRTTVLRMFEFTTGLLRDATRPLKQ